MHGLSEHQLLISLSTLTIVLLVGRGTAEVARRMGQPEVLGELLGGVLLGPSVIGLVAPKWYHSVIDDPGVALPLSMFSWIGAILLLMLAGAEVDLLVLRSHIKAGSAAALFGIAGAVGIGTAFGITYFHQELASALFLGLVLSVTAVSVVAKIFMQHQSFRRDYAQVILAAGIASEVVVWPAIAMLSAIQGEKTWLSAGLTTLYAVLFFVVAMTWGQRWINWCMRKIADVTQITFGRITLLMVLGMAFACLTDMLGLHGLLGPFVLGILIGRAPRTSHRMKENLESLTLSLFAPVFFVSAGMRIDLASVSNFGSLQAIVLLFCMSLLGKAFCGFVGSKLGGLSVGESALVGLGISMRGGSDVVVAILGVSLGLLPNNIYSIYAIIAILTVLVSPPVIARISEKVLPSASETARLTKEEAKKNAYLSGIEKIMLGSVPMLLPNTCLVFLKALATTKDAQHEILDIIEFSPADDNQDLVAGLLDAANGCDLLMIGAPRPDSSAMLTFGASQDKVIDQAVCDVLVVVDGNRLIKRIRRILVPVNGLEHSLGASDIAAYVAAVYEAEVVLFTAVQSPTPIRKGELGYHRLVKSGAKVLREAVFRTRRLEIRIREKIVIASDPAQAVIDEIASGGYDLLIMGAIDRHAETGIELGPIAPRILCETTVPTALLVLHPLKKQG